MFKKISDRIVRTSTKQASMLFVGDTHPRWQKTLDNAGRNLGQLKLVKLEHLKQEALIYDLYILDDKHISNIPSVIQKIRKQQATARIIVISDNPTWRKSRDALRAGAIDYIQRDDNYRALRKSLHDNLQKQLGACC